jgi:iron-sulfur cluster repair protein YtfE (RIC family)
MARHPTSSRHIDPIAQFMQEHDEALMHLSSLNKSTHSLVEHGYSKDAFAKVLVAMKFLQDEIGLHNKKEEEALFPVLERYVEGPTQVMRNDHKRLKKEFTKLKRSVTKYTKNKQSNRAAKEMEVHAKSIVQGLVNHIHKENYILFPLVQRFLTKDALREVARLMLHS